jgi:hypothetical protein
MTPNEYYDIIISKYNSGDYKVKVSKTQTTTPEVNEKELYKNCGLIGEIDTFLNIYHFKRVLTNITCHGWGDALYIRK